METVADFFFSGSKITVDGYHSHEIKKCLFLGRKAMAKLDSVSESRDKSGDKTMKGALLSWLSPWEARTSPAGDPLRH